MQLDLILVTSHVVLGVGRRRGRRLRDVVVAVTARKLRRRPDVVLDGGQDGSRGAVVGLLAQLRRELDGSAGGRPVALQLQLFGKGQLDVDVPFEEPSVGIVL